METVTVSAFCEAHGIKAEAVYIGEDHGFNEEPEEKDKKRLMDHWKIKFSRVIPGQPNTEANRKEAEMTVDYWTGLAHRKFYPLGADSNDETQAHSHTRQPPRQNLTAKTQKK